MNRTDPGMITPGTHMRRCWMGLADITRQIPEGQQTTTLGSAAGMIARSRWRRMAQLNPGFHLELHLVRLLSSQVPMHRLYKATS